MTPKVFFGITFRRTDGIYIAQIKVGDRYRTVPLRTPDQDLAAWRRDIAVEAFSKFIDYHVRFNFPLRASERKEIGIFVLQFSDNYRSCSSDAPYDADTIDFFMVLRRAIAGFLNEGIQVDPDAQTHARRSSLSGNRMDIAKEMLHFKQSIGRLESFANNLDTKNSGALQWARNTFGASWSSLIERKTISDLLTEFEDAMSKLQSVALKIRQTAQNEHALVAKKYPNDLMNVSPYNPVAVEAHINSTPSLVARWSAYCAEQERLQELEQERDMAKGLEARALGAEPNLTTPSEPAVSPSEQ